MNPQEALAAYAALLRRWAPRLDLVSPGDLDRLEERHIADSVRAAPILDRLPDGPCADVGSGAGFPGIPLAIVRPGRRWRLIEPRKRRAAFLEEAVRELGLDCEVVPLTAEEAARSDELRASHVLAAARALAEPARVPELTGPLLRPGGVTLLFTGGAAQAPEGAEEWGPGLTIIREPLREEGG